MFEIYGGKAAFDQWDLNQRVTCSCLKVGDPVVFNAHGKRHVDKAYAKDGGVWADVPNFLLQKHGSIRVELGHGLDVHLNCRTYFDVVKKDKPADYDCPYNVVLEGGNSGGASSWNDLKDKPFYTETVEKTVDVVASQMANLPGFTPFKAGDTVTIKIGGVEHSLVAYEDNGYAVIGHFGDLGWSVMMYGGVPCVASKNDTTVSYTAELVHKLDAKYLPDYDVVIECGNTANWNDDKAGTYVKGSYADVYDAIMNYKRINILVNYIFVYGETYHRAMIPVTIQLCEETGAITLYLNYNGDSTWDNVILESDGRIW